MKNFDVKFKRIFIPFLIISAGSIITYSFLRWLLFVKYSVLVVDEDILNFVAPIFFVLIPIIALVGPRVKLLDLTPGFRSDPFAALMIFATVAIAGPTIATQNYLEAATGKLTRIERISQIDSVVKTKYYMVKNYYADKNLAGYRTYTRVSGKHDSYLDMYFYVAVPLYNASHFVKTYNYKIGAKGNPISSDNALIVLNGKVISKEALSAINPKAIKNITVLKGRPAQRLYGNMARNGVILLETQPYNGPDTLQNVYDDNARYHAFAWLGIRYQKTIDNNLPAVEKDSSYSQFAEKSEAVFKAMRLDNLVYLNRVAYNADFRAYQAAVNGRSNGMPNIMVPVYESFDIRAGNKLLWAIGAFLGGSVFFMLLLLAKPLRVDVIASIDRRDKTQQILDEITAKNSSESES